MGCLELDEAADAAAVRWLKCEWLHLAHYNTARLHGCMARRVPQLQQLHIYIYLFIYLLLHLPS